MRVNYSTSIAHLYNIKYVLLWLTMLTVDCGMMQRKTPASELKGGVPKITIVLLFAVNLNLNTHMVKMVDHAKMGKHL